jgi:hypothetical protein
MSHGWLMTLNLASVVMGAAAALLLYWGSLTVPWKLRSWSGETDIERRYERTQSLMGWLGIPCVLLAAAFQAIAIIFGPN